MYNFLSMFSGWESEIIIWLQRFAGDFMILLNKFFSTFGEEMIFVAIIGILYWGFDKKMGEFVGFSVLTTNILNPMIKNIAKRPRPYMQNSSVKCLKPIDQNASISDIVAQGYSFPSGHSSGSAALYPSLAIYDNKGKKYKFLIVIAVVLPFLVGFSRVFLGVHYPTDVIAGWALGLAVVVLMSTLLQVVRNKYIVYIATLCITALGMIYCRTNDYFTSFGMLLGLVPGVFFEEKLIKFENTDLWWRIIIRTVLGGAIFFALNALIKLPVSLIEGGDAWLDGSSWGQFIFRSIRYATILFLLIGVYPISFRLGDKIFTKLGWIKQTNDNLTYKR